MGSKKGEWEYAGDGVIIAPDGRQIASVFPRDREANVYLIKAAPALKEALEEADKVICKLCKRLNPQHVSMDYGQGCSWCKDRDVRLKALAQARRE